MRKQQVLFLYFELAGYFLACVERLLELYDVDVHIVKYPVNAVAPFQFAIDKRIKIYETDDYTQEKLIELAHKLKPDAIYVSGWSNKKYMAVARSFKKQIPVILAFDNPWLGTLKQRIATIAGPFYLPRIFTHCWVPGEPNAVYARKLGINGEKLLLGKYSADYTYFHGLYNEFHAGKKQSFPKRFIYVGRYTPLKGVRELWKAFVELQRENPNEWELWCLGKGELENEFPVHPKIKNMGFIQPPDMKPYIQQAGVFILPAYYEHWGVVVHEFAAAGFPLICTTTTSAASAFLEDGKNGYLIAPENTEAIKNALLKIVNSSDEQLNAMAKHSVQLSSHITPSTWSDTLMSLIN